MAGGVTGGAAGAWSDRFEQGLHPFIEAFNASIGFDLTLLQEDLDGSIAHARMLASCGVIAEEEAVQLVEGLEMIRTEAADGRFHPGLADEDGRSEHDEWQELFRKLHINKTTSNAVKQRWAECKRKLEEDL